MLMHTSPEIVNKNPRGCLYPPHAHTNLQPRHTPPASAAHTRRHELQTRQQANRNQYPDTTMAEAAAEPAHQQASATTTVQQESAESQHGGGDQAESVEAPTLTLRLRPRPSVSWGADVINNEGMGKKSSKSEL